MPGPISCISEQSGAHGRALRAGPDVLSHITDGAACSISDSAHVGGAVDGMTP